MVATILYVVIRFKVDKRTIIAQVFDIDNGRSDITRKARVDGDGVIGGFGHTELFWNVIVMLDMLRESRL